MLFTALAWTKPRRAFSLKAWWFEHTPWGRREMHRRFLRLANAMKKEADV